MDAIEEVLGIAIEAYRSQARSWTRAAVVQASEQCFGAMAEEALSHILESASYMPTRGELEQRIRQRFDLGGKIGWFVDALTVAWELEDMVAEHVEQRLECSGIKAEDPLAARMLLTLLILPLSKTELAEAANRIQQFQR